MKSLVYAITLACVSLPLNSFAASKLSVSLGALDSLRPSVYQMKQRPEPTALREVLELESHRNELLALARIDFATVTWVEPGVQQEARVVALREAVYLALGRWGGLDVEEFLMGQLGQDLLSDSTERALLKALGNMKVSVATERRLMARLELAERNPQTRYETLLVIMKQGRLSGEQAYAAERARSELTSLQVTKLGAELILSRFRSSTKVSMSLWRQVLADAAKVQDASFAAEAVWQALVGL